MVDPRMRRVTHALAHAAMGAALIAAGAFAAVPLPFTPVPATLQTLSVFLVAAVFGPRRGMLTVIVYLLLGMAGMPVFAAMQAGPGILFGPTGGYLIGFLPMTFITGWLSERAKGFAGYCAAMICGAAALYALGTAWLMVSAGMTPAAALSAAVIPFLAPEAVKIIAAAYAAPLIRRGMAKHVK
jgi:biotin transport system substrate-specific component